MYISGLVFGAVLAVYILSHYDSRVKKVYALIAAVIAALTALADFTSAQIPVAQECRTDPATGVQTCVTKYSNDAAPLIFFILSVILLVAVLIELSVEGAASVWP
jgi:Mg/Co/Ni transporter MgtE